MKEETYKKRNITTNYVGRWINTAEMIVGTGKIIEGYITKNHELSYMGTVLEVIGALGLHRETGIVEGETHFYKENSNPTEKSKLTRRIRDFYFPSKEEEFITYNPITGRMK